MSDWPIRFLGRIYLLYDIYYFAPKNNLPVLNHSCKFMFQHVSMFPVALFCWALVSLILYTDHTTALFYVLYSVLYPFGNAAIQFFLPLSGWNNFCLTWCHMHTANWNCMSAISPHVTFLLSLCSVWSSLLINHPDFAFEAVPLISLLSVHFSLLAPLLPFPPYFPLFFSFFWQYHRKNSSSRAAHSNYDLRLEMDIQTQQNLSSVHHG